MIISLGFLQNVAVILVYLIDEAISPVRSRTFFLILLRCAPFISQCKYVSHSTEFGLQFDVLGENLYFFPCVSAELLLSLLLRFSVFGF